MIKAEVYLGFEANSRGARYGVSITRRNWEIMDAVLIS